MRVILGVLCILTFSYSVASTEEKSCTETVVTECDGQLVVTKVVNVNDDNGQVVLENSLGCARGVRQVATPTDGGVSVDTQYCVPPVKNNNGVVKVQGDPVVIVRACPQTPSFQGTFTPSKNPDDWYYCASLIKAK